MKNPFDLNNDEQEVSGGAVAGKLLLGFGVVVIIIFVIFAVTHI